MKGENMEIKSERLRTEKERGREGERNCRHKCSHVSLTTSGEKYFHLSLQTSFILACDGCSLFLTLFLWKNYLEKGEIRWWLFDPKFGDIFKGFPFIANLIRLIALIVLYIYIKFSTLKKKDQDTEKKGWKEKVMEVKSERRRTENEWGKRERETVDTNVVMLAWQLQAKNAFLYLSKLCFKRSMVVPLEGFPPCYCE